MTFDIEICGIDLCCHVDEVPREDSVGISHWFDVWKITYKGVNVTRFAEDLFTMQTIEELVYEQYERAL